MKKIDGVNMLYPTPTTIVGTVVEGKPNYLAIAWVGIVGRNRVSICVNKGHYSNKGIKVNEAFSVNVPSMELMEVTDYVGLKSGRDTDKSGLFTPYYGDLEGAPLITECPVCMECKLVYSLDTDTHNVYIGEIQGTYCDESVLVDGKVDPRLVDPILFSMQDNGYYRLGERVASAWEIGHSYKEEGNKE